jgi:hypothetical protein
MQFKSTSRTASGEAGSGALYLAWKEDGKVRTKYIGPAKGKIEIQKGKFLYWRFYDLKDKRSRGVYMGRVGEITLKETPEHMQARRKIGGPRKGKAKKEIV